MRKTLLCAAIALAASTSAFADSYYTLGAGVEHFDWREFSNGSHLLKESGERGVIKGRFDGNQGRVVYNVSGKLFTGEIQYTGATWAGTPVETDTDYNGYQAEASLGWRFPLSGFESNSLDVLAGIGMDKWDRDIKDGTDVLGNPVQGYKEEYEAPYAKVGVAWAVVDGNWFHRVSAGVKRPLDVKETIPEFNARLAPQPTNTFFLSYDFAETNSGLGLSLWYEKGKFDESPVANSSVGLVMQPESRFEAIGASINVSF